MILTKLEYISKYKQSILGVLWTFLQPLIQLLVFSFIFTFVAPIESKNIPYPIFLFSVLIFWDFFRVSVVSSITTIQANRDMISNISFPYSFLPLSAVISNMFSSIGALIIFLLLIHIYNFQVTLNYLLCIPLFIIVFIYAYALSLLVACFHTFYHDIKNLVAVCLNILFYFTPIVYSISNLPDWARQYTYLNPLVYPMEGFRQIICYDNFISPKSLLISLVEAIIIFIISLLLYKLLKNKIADSL